MAQLRDAYDDFTSPGCEILVAGPEGPDAFRNYWQRHRLPFVGLPDPSHKVLKLYGQEIKLFKLGRMPAQVVVDRTGRVRFVHYGHAMGDIPETGEILAILDQLSSKEVK